MKSRISLVGAGPGDPELLTLAAYRRLQEAEVVLYDRLVSQEILALIETAAVRIDVGKQCGQHRISQAEINDLLVYWACSGRRVVRLKGGDPMVFGRAGEEIAALEAAGVEVEVIPGITAALGCAAAARIPLTQRGMSQRLLFVTGQGAECEDWGALTRQGQTLVVYMGLSQLAKLCTHLIAEGLPPSHPVALVSKGTTAEQRVVCGDLRDIWMRALEAGLESPTLAIIGEVTRKHVSTVTPDLRTGSGRLPEAAYGR
jgi:uroporphyrin-III C-methyltransferase